MQVRKQFSINAERGVSLSGLIGALVVIGVVAVFAMKVVPSYVEHSSIKTAIAKAKAEGGSVGEMQRIFDKAAEINNISSVSGRDLVIGKENGQTEISYAYEKRVPLVGNVSLVIDFAGSTAPGGVSTATASAGQ